MPTLDLRGCLYIEAIETPAFEIVSPFVARPIRSEFVSVNPWAIVELCTTNYTNGGRDGGGGPKLERPIWKASFGATLLRDRKNNTRRLSNWWRQLNLGLCKGELLRFHCASVSETPLSLSLFSRAGLFFLGFNILYIPTPQKLNQASSSHNSFSLGYGNSHFRTDTVNIANI